VHGFCGLPVPAHPCICSPARATPDSITTLDRVAGRAPINTGHHRTAARIERVFPAQLTGRYSRTGPSLHGEEAQACPPCRSEDLLLPLNLPTPAATKGGETDRRCSKRGRGSRPRPSALSDALTCPRHVSPPTSVHTYASPSDAWLSGLVLGHLSRPFQICLRRRRASGVRRLLALRYARDMFQCSERGCPPAVLSTARSTPWGGASSLRRNGPHSAPSCRAPAACYN
jgi:hypothetical protein